MLTACLERESRREFWRKRLEINWIERAVRECITFNNCIRLTPIFCTVLNYSTTGSRSRCCSLGVLWNAETCSPVVLTEEWRHWLEGAVHPFIVNRIRKTLPIGR